MRLSESATEAVDTFSFLREVEPARAPLTADDSPKAKPRKLLVYERPVKDSSYKSEAKRRKLLSDVETLLHVRHGSKGIVQSSPCLR